jgi:hypothetical protein
LAISGVGLLLLQASVLSTTSALALALAGASLVAVLVSTGWFLLRRD